MGNKQNRCTEPMFQVSHQVQDLRLDRNVEGSCWFVGNQDRRRAGQRHRDHDSLAHAAG